MCIVSHNTYQACPFESVDSLFASGRVLDTDNLASSPPLLRPRRAAAAFHTKDILPDSEPLARLPPTDAADSFSAQRALRRSLRRHIIPQFQSLKSGLSVLKMDPASTGSEQGPSSNANSTLRTHLRTLVESV